MNPTEDGLNTDDDPLATVDPLATYDPEMTIDRAGDVTDRQSAGAVASPDDDVAATLDEPDATLDESSASGLSGEVTLAEEDQSRIQGICREFESAWQSGDGEPQVEAFVPSEMDGGLRQLLVRELVLLDIDYRKQKSITLETTAYLSKLPDCREAVESAFSRRRSSSSTPKGYGSVTPPQSTRRDGRNQSLPASSHDPTSRYRATEFHARGGLGAVYRARDEELKRLVALKEILPDHAGNVKCQDRFVFEAEVTGSLEHPGIVPVYGLGRYQDRRPYYAMRFIRGHSFRSVIKEFHDQNPSPSSSEYFGREFRMLLRRLIETCNAIHYAHEHGVLHRDIKPDNIMLGKYGETLVVDWGLAKLVDADSDHVSSRIDSMRIEVTGSGTRTSQGSAVGTPMYMSPEQAMGLHDSLDGRTDVYSLGAMLFNVVTGKHPVEGTTGREIVIKVREGSIKDVNAVTPQAPRPLASICRKAMELKPENRYQTAVELADDLERWMSDEPVQAHIGHEGLAERAGRLIRRYRSWTISGAVALLVITAAAVLSAILINNAKKKEQIAKQEAVISKQDAVARYRDSREAIDTWLVQSSDALEFFPGTQTVRQRLLELATEDYEKLAGKESTDPELELERGRAMVKLGDLLRRQEEHDRAVERYNEALSLFAVHSDNPQLGLPFKVEHGNVHSKLALALLGLDKIDDAQRELKIAIDELTALADSGPDDSSRRMLAVAHVNAGELDWIVGETDLARQHLGTALRRYGEMESADDAKRDVGVAKIHQLLGDIEATLGRHESALAEFDQVVAKLTPLVAADPDHPEYFDLLAAAHVSKAASFRTQGLETELFASLAAAVDSYRALRVAMPNVPRFDENYAIALTDQAIAFHEAAANADAEDALIMARSQFVELVDTYGRVPRFRQRLAACEDALGQVLLDRSDASADASALLADATTRYQDLHDRSLRGVPADTPQDPMQTANSRVEYVAGIAIAQSHYAQALQREGKPEEAQSYFIGAIDLLGQLIAARDQPAYHNALAHVHDRFGRMLLEQDDETAAREQFSEARDQWMGIGDEIPASYAHDLAWMLAVCPDLTIRDPQAARTWAAKAVELAPENPRYLTTAALATLLADKDAASVKVTLEQVKAARGHWIDRDYFVAALAEHESDPSEPAQQSLAQGIRWMDENRPQNSDSQLLRDLVETALASEGK